MRIDEAIREFRQIIKDEPLGILSQLFRLHRLLPTGGADISLDSFERIRSSFFFSKTIKIERRAEE